MGVNGTQNADTLDFSATAFTKSSLVLDGMGGHDELTGTSDNDMIKGGTGNDDIDGDDGIDTAVFSSVFSDYEITKDGTLWYVSDLRKTGTDREGVDTLSNIEKLQFADGTFSIVGDDILPDQIL